MFLRSFFLFAADPSFGFLIMLFGKYRVGFYFYEYKLLENSEKGSGEMTISLGIGPTDEAVVFVMYGSLLGTYGNTYYITGAEPLRRYT